MGNRTAKFISALVGSVIAGAPLAAVSQNAPSASSPANAASDCLASPKGIAPHGQHWRYRVERGTKRQCWYLRAEGGKDSAKAVQTAQAATDTPTADSPAPQQHSVQNARAEYLTPQSSGAPSTPTAPARAAATTPAPTQQPANPTSDNDTQQPAVATRWPDASTTADQPAAQPAPAPVAAAAQPSTKPSKSPAPVALAAADSTDNTTGSLQMLLLVVGGALALAGVLASIIYRFAGGRVRAQAGDHRRVKWDNREPQDHDDSHAPWRSAEIASAPRARRPVDFDAARPQPARLAAFTNAIGRIATQSASARIEAAEPDEAEIAEFNREFEINASAPRLAANGVHDQQPADRNEDAREDEPIHMDDIVDVDVITAMLERLAKDGPRLSQPSLEADLADPARSRRDQSAARA